MRMIRCILLLHNLIPIRGWLIYLKVLSKKMIILWLIAKYRLLVILLLIILYLPLRFI